MAQADVRTLTGYVQHSLKTPESPGLRGRTTSLYKQQSLQLRAKPKQTNHIKRVEPSHLSEQKSTCFTENNTIQTPYNISSIISRVCHVHGLKLVYRFNNQNQKELFLGGRNCFLQNQDLSEHTALQFLFPLILHPRPNHTLIRHLAQLTTSSSEFLSTWCPGHHAFPVLLCLVIPFVSFSSAGSPYFSQTAKCFRCHRASVFGHFLSSVHFPWVVTHG